MMMNSHIHGLDSITRFESFLNFIENPGEYKKIILELKQVIKDFDENTLKQRKIKDIDVWHDLLFSQNKETEERLKKEKEALSNLKQDFEEYQNKRKDELTKAFNDLKEKENSIESKMKEFKSLVEDKKDLDRAFQDYKDKLNELTKKEAFLKERENQLKKFLG